MQRTFETPEPVLLYVEIGAGSVAVRAEDTSATAVRIDGSGADDVAVEQDGGQITVIAPRRTGFLGRHDSDLRVTVTVPSGSSLATRTGSADQAAAGPLHEVRAKSGSGEVRIESAAGTVAIDTGSGDVTVGEAASDVRCKCGSGDVRLGRVAGDVVVSTGSGDIEIERADGKLATKTGSGSVRIGHAATDVATSTASGDVAVRLLESGGLVARTASGDVRVGVPSGIPVWTDVSTVSGRVHSTLEGAGQPKDGEPYLDLNVTTVSGDIVLDQR